MANNGDMNHCNPPYTFACEGSVAEWIRVLVLKSGGPGFKASTLLLAGFVSRYSRIQILGHAL